MYQPRRLHLTQHRRRRLILWALAMLMWIASLLTGAPPAFRHLRQRHRKMSLDGLALMVKQLILLRAAEIARQKRKTRPIVFRRGRNLLRRHFMRSVYGSRLRRALRHRDPITRVTILMDALTRLDVWAARFAQRLRCGFMRLWSIPPAPTSAMVILGPPPRPPACWDSS